MTQSTMAKSANTALIDTYLYMYVFSFWLMVIIVLAIVLNIFFPIIPMNMSMRSNAKYILYLLGCIGVIYIASAILLHFEIQKLPTFIDAKDVQQRKFDYVASNSLLLPLLSRNGFYRYGIISNIRQYIEKSGAKRVHYYGSMTLNPQSSFASWAANKFPNKSASILIVNTGLSMNDEYGLYRRLVQNGYTNVYISNM